MVSRLDHKRQMLLRLGSAAVACFEANGPDVTIGAIAQRAGVSRRTVFRYVAAKEELLFVHPRLWLPVWEGALDRSLPLAERLMRASRAVANTIDSDPDPPKRAMRLAGRFPSLSEGFSRVYQQWVDRVADEVLVDLPGAELESRVLASALMGAVDASLRVWLSSDGAYGPFFERGFALARPVLESLPSG